MSPFSVMTMLQIRPAKAKKKVEQPPLCPHCHERWRIRGWGHYWRACYGPGSNERIAVARYECRNPQCPRRTFSVPPHGMLPHVQIPLCVLMALYRLHVDQEKPLNLTAHLLNHSWTTIRRAVALARRLLDWCRQEVAAGVLPPRPCHPDQWPTFCRAFSYAFYPGRYVTESINTIK
jgi:hypothetical protein